MAATLEITDFSLLDDEAEFFQGLRWQDIEDAIGEELSAMRAGYKSFDDFLACRFPLEPDSDEALCWACQD